MGFLNNLCYNNKLLSKNINILIYSKIISYDTIYPLSYNFFAICYHFSTSSFRVKIENVLSFSKIENRIEIILEVGSKFCWFFSLFYLLYFYFPPSELIISISMVTLCRWLCMCFLTCTNKRTKYTQNNIS